MDGQIAPGQIARREILAREERAEREGLMREGGQRVERMVDRRLLRPWPEEQHHRKSDDNDRDENAAEISEALGKEDLDVPRLDAAPQGEEAEQEPEISEQQQPADAHAERQAAGEAESR